MNDDDGCLARTAARLYTAIAAWLGAASLVFTASAFAVLAWAAPTRPWLPALAVLGGLAALERAIRVRFDAALFADLAASPASQARLDAALARLFPARNTPPGRSIDERIAGTRRLAIMLASLVATQAALLLAGLAVP